MSQPAQASIKSPSAESTAPARAAAMQNPAPVLITVEQVAFSTAAAVTARPPRRRWLMTAVSARLQRGWAALKEPKPHYPRREPAYFETARMSRAMDRL